MICGDSCTLTRIQRSYFLWKAFSLSKPSWSLRTWGLWRAGNCSQLAFAIPSKIISWNYMSIYVMISYDIIPFILHAWFIEGYLGLVIQPTVERAAPKGTIWVMSSLKFIVFRIQQFDSALAQTHTSWFFPNTREIWVLVVHVCLDSFHVDFFAHL